MTRFDESLLTWIARGYAVPVIRLNPYLVLAGSLSVTACYDDVDAENTATGTTRSSTGSTGSGGTLASSTTSSSTAPSTTTTTSGTMGGSAGEGNGGSGGEGVGGLAGAGGAPGAGGEGGAGFECRPALYALVRATFGDFVCPELEACFADHCADEVAAAMGDGWASGDHSGGICADYAACVETCDCGPDCSLECRGAHASGGACLDAINEASLCRSDACPDATDDCGP